MPTTTQAPRRSAKTNQASTPVKRKAKAAAPAPTPATAPVPAAADLTTFLTTLPNQPKLNEKQQKVRLSKTAKAALQMREELWPGVGNDKLWLRTDLSRKGYTTIPRGMPLFMEIISSASKQVTSGKSVPAGHAYLVLWCRVFDEGLVKIDNDTTAAFEAGYSGERSVSTWREHLRVLKELGFIDYKPGPAGPCQYILLFNPYHAVVRLRAKSWVQDVTYTALLQRMSDIGATDLEGAIG